MVNLEPIAARNVAQVMASLWFTVCLSSTNLITRLTALGQQRKSAEATETSAFGGKAEVDFGRLEVCF
jgi:hypothetical protein